MEGAGHYDARRGVSKWKVYSDLSRNVGHDESTLQHISKKSISQRTSVRYSG